MPSTKFTMPKFSSVDAFKMPKMPKFNMGAPKTPGLAEAKSFDFSKLSKGPKLPKSPKVKIMKLAIKKLKK